MKTLRAPTRLYLTLLLAVLAFFGGESAGQEVQSRLENYLREQVEDKGIPGLAAAFVRDGKVIYSGAFGVRKLGEGEPLTAQHIFHFASVSKPFVATAIVQLVEKGKLDLDAPITDALAYFELADERFRDITIRQMLNHTSGMPDVEDYEWDDPQFDVGAAERYVRSMASERLLWAPGDGWRYSNMAFDVLGDVIAKASGMSFEEYVQTYILTPLGMNESSFIYPDINESLRTTGHVSSPPRVSPVYPYNRRHAPSSTLNSSVAEMTKWMLANLNRGELNGSRILETESYELLWTPTADTTRDGAQIGLSWFLSEYNGHRTVFHSGGDTGFRSYLLMLPDEGIGMVLAINWSRGGLSRSVLDQLLDLLLEDGGF